MESIKNVGLGMAVMTMYVKGKFRMFAKCFVGFNESEDGFVFAECSALYWASSDTPHRIVRTPDGYFWAVWNDIHEYWIIDYSKKCDGFTE